MKQLHDKIFTIALLLSCVISVLQVQASHASLEKSASATSDRVGGLSTHSMGLTFDRPVSAATSAHASSSKAPAINTSSANAPQAIAAAPVSISADKPVNGSSLSLATCRKPQVVAQRKKPRFNLQLIQAIKNGLHTAAYALLDGQIDPNGTDNAGNSALHYAVMAGAEQLVRRLLDANASAAAQNKDGFTALGLALSRAEFFENESLSRIALMLQSRMKEVTAQPVVAQLNYAGDRWDNYSSGKEFRREYFVTVPVYGVIELPNSDLTGNEGDLVLHVQRRISNFGTVSKQDPTCLMLHKQREMVAYEPNSLTNLAAIYVKTILRQIDQSMEKIAQYPWKNLSPIIQDYVGFTIRDVLDQYSRTMQY